MLGDVREAVCQGANDSDPDQQPLVQDLRYDTLQRSRLHLFGMDIWIPWTLERARSRKDLGMFEIARSDLIRGGVDNG